MSFTKSLSLHLYGYKQAFDSSLLSILEINWLKIHFLLESLKEGVAEESIEETNFYYS